MVLAVHANVIIIIIKLLIAVILKYLMSTQVCQVALCLPEVANLSQIQVTQAVCQAIVAHNVIIPILRVSKLIMLSFSYI